MSITILRGNALALPIADASVDLVVTSPPYFGLRSYQDGASAQPRLPDRPWIEKAWPRRAWET